MTLPRNAIARTDADRPPVMGSKPVSDCARPIRPHGRRIAVTLACLSTLTMVLAACGSSGTSTPIEGAGGPSVSSTATGEGTPAASAGGGDDAKAAAIDVCSLLTPADAQTIGTSNKLSPLPNVTYKLMSEKPEKTAQSSNCTLTIYNELADGTPGNEAIVTVQVDPAKYLDTISGKKMTGGPGDAAYDDGGFDQVISGDYLLEAVQSQGASRELIDDMYRAMIPNLKKQLASS
jgi:hypothetical protein